MILYFQGKEEKRVLQITSCIVQCSEFGYKCSLFLTIKAVSSIYILTEKLISFVGYLIFNIFDIFVIIERQ